MYLVTGASGFIGNALVKRLIKDGLPPTLAIRNLDCNVDLGCNTFKILDLGGEIDWSSSLVGIKYVIHCAGRAHIMNDNALDPLLEFRRVNVFGTLNLAKQAAASGVSRFIFISTIKVNGDSTEIGLPYTENSIPKPADPYAVSKLEAEEGLFRIAIQTGMEVVVIRPTLVYGNGVKGNFLVMMNWLGKGFPLPFGGINNLRSFIGIDNFVDLIITCLHHPSAANEIFLAADGEDISTSELLRRISFLMGKTNTLIYVPTSLIRAIAFAMGRVELTRRLYGSLQVDISKSKERLGWTPPISMEQGLERMIHCRFSE